MTSSQRKREPVRLARQGGNWIIEFTRLVAVDDQLMRPERRSVAATTDALRSLALSCPPERIREAEALMGQKDDGSERVFELADEGWQPAPTVRHSQRPLARREASTLVSELKAQLLGMRALYDALQQRVVALEAAAHERQVREPEAPKVRKVPSRRDMLLSLQNSQEPPPSAVDVLARTRVAAPEPEPSVAPSPSARAHEAAPPTQQSAEGLAPPGNPRLILPSASDIIGCLQMLAADVEVKLDKSAIPRELGDCMVARLADESQEVIGVLLLNQRAAADFGGGLLGMPQATRDEQAQRGLDKDAFEALSEVMNNLGGLVNRSNPKCYTRLAALERASLDAVPWLAQPAKMLALATPGGGRLFLASR
jgi:hypothetical protein